MRQSCATKGGTHPPRKAPTGLRTGSATVDTSSLGVVLWNPREGAVRNEERRTTEEGLVTEKRAALAKVVSVRENMTGYSNLEKPCNKKKL